MFQTQSSETKVERKIIFGNKTYIVHESVHWKGFLRECWFYYNPLAPKSHIFNKSRLCGFRGGGGASTNTLECADSRTANKLCCT